VLVGSLAEMVLSGHESVVVASQRAISRNGYGGSMANIVRDSATQANRVARLINRNKLCSLSESCLQTISDKDTVAHNSVLHGRLTNASQRFYF